MDALNKDNWRTLIYFLSQFSSSCFLDNLGIYKSQLLAFKSFFMTQGCSKHICCAQSFYLVIYSSDKCF